MRKGKKIEQTNSIMTQNRDKRSLCSHLHFLFISHNCTLSDHFSYIVTSSNILCNCQLFTIENRRLCRLWFTLCGSMVSTVIITKSSTDSIERFVICKTLCRHEWTWTFWCIWTMPLSLGAVMFETMSKQKTMRNNGTHFWLYGWMYEYGWLCDASFEHFESPKMPLVSLKLILTSNCPSTCYLIDL